ncbi:MAG: dihydroorotate dehydrogenase [Spirochaetaceae bacterium]|nr:MAG: dihydroorotate dehydrogenase [Spirochaetaceae bacterium]
MTHRAMDCIETMQGSHLRRDTAVLLATVSGIATTNPGMIEWFARETMVTVITTKSFQVEPNCGNREPVITEPQPGSFGNAVGLRNPGLAVARSELTELRSRWSELRPAITESGIDTVVTAAVRDGTQPALLLNVSIAGRDEAEFRVLARELAPLADLLELNLSCPHAGGGYGAAIGCDPVLVARCTRAAVDAAGATPVFAKLTPNTSHIGAIAQRAVAAGATGIVAINTVGPEQYRERETGTVILNNPALQGRGGQSGRWVRERALECVRDIRRAIGPQVPIIGMGGVERPADARAMRAAGADVVGVGSALALVHQQDWPGMLRAMAQPGADSRVRYRPKAGMDYRRLAVSHRRELGGGLFELGLRGSLTFEPGQSCFLRLPEIGEKPFSPALADPATFLIRRRGPFTNALGTLEPNGYVFVRGPYGEGPGVIDAEAAGTAARMTPGTAYILAAGSGAALAPRLALRLTAAGLPVRIWLGLRDDVTGIPLATDIERHGPLSVVHDRGTLGRVIHEALASPDVRAGGVGSLWVIGPAAFMRASAAEFSGSGVPFRAIRCSLEEEMLCGVGLCGMCHRDGRLTCQYGTFTGERT